MHAWPRDHGVINVTAGGEIVLLMRLGIRELQ